MKVSVITTNDSLGIFYACVVSEFGRWHVVDEAEVWCFEQYGEKCRDTWWMPNPVQFNFRKNYMTMDFKIRWG